MDFNDLQIAAMVLIDGGASREDAMSSLLTDPGAVERLAPQIATKRASFEQKSVEAEQAAFDASPQGRRELAEATHAAKLERAQQAEHARTLLEIEGDFNVKHLSDDEVLWASGIEKKPGHLLSAGERDEALVQLAGRWHELPAEQRSAEARELRTDPAVIEHYVEKFGGRHTSPVGSTS